MSNIFSILVVTVTAFAGGEVTGSNETGVHMLKSTVEYCTESIAPYFNDARTSEYEGVNYVVKTEATCYSVEQFMKKHHEGMDHKEHHKKMHGDKNHSH